MESIKVRDVMTRGVITMPLEARVREIAEVLADEHIEAIVITAPGGEMMGLISELDIIKAFNEDLDSVKAEDIMSTPVKTVDPEVTLRDAAELMKVGNIHRLVIASEPKGRAGLPVGILCASDIIKKVASR